jgi:hypothetical protein
MYAMSRTDENTRDKFADTVHEIDADAGADIGRDLSPGNSSRLR